MTPDSLAGLRASWQREWPQASAGSHEQRSAMLDKYAEMHASSHLLEATAEPGDLLDLDDDLGRALTARVVRRILPSAGPLGHVLPVLAAPGEKPLKVERSRPDWHLNGTVREVAWDPDAELLAVFAVDEGGNDVLALVAPGTARIGITETEAPAGGRASVDLCFDDVALPAVAHCPGEPARLADGLTVLAMADVIHDVSLVVDRPRDHTALGLCRAALGAAARSLTSTSSVRRQHDVSAAVLLVLPTCLRLAADAHDQDDPEMGRRVRGIRERALALPAWHRERLVALV